MNETMHIINFYGAISLTLVCNPDLHPIIIGAPSQQMFPL